MRSVGQYIKTSTTTIWRDEQGIFHKKYLPNAFVTEADLLENRKALLTLSNGERGLLLFIDGRNLKGYSPEARALVTSKEMSRYYRASAGLVGNPLTRVIASFFLGINKPAYPVKMFTNKEEAIKWLLGQQLK